MAPLTNVEVEMEASSIITQVTREEDQITSFAQEKGDLCLILKDRRIYFTLVFSLLDLIDSREWRETACVVCVYMYVWCLCVCVLCSYKVWEGLGRSRGGVLGKEGLRVEVRLTGEISVPHSYMLP